MSKVQHRRKTIVMVGSGTMFRATEAVLRSGTRVYSPEWSDAIQSAGRANVSLYLIDPAGLTGANYDGALAFASETGGQAFVNSNLFDRAVNQIWNEAGHYYLLGYEAPRSNRKTHTIDVKVKRRGVEVRARRTRGGEHL